MYLHEISKFKISDLKAQKIIILWTMKHVSAIRKHPVPSFSKISISFFHSKNYSMMMKILTLFFLKKN